MTEHGELLGMQVQFDPFAEMAGYGVEMVRKTVTGTVVYVNEKNRWFSVEYGDPKQRIGFKFADIGRKVKLLGKRKGATRGGK